MITIRSEKLHLSPGNRILDIGCGDGRHTIMTAQQKKTVCVGADFGFDSLVRTQEKIGIHRQFEDLACQSVDLACMDIKHLPFADQSFNTVICSEVLEHIPEDLSAMAELNRVLKCGGVLAVSVPRFWPEKICWLLSDDYVNAEGGHVRIYRKKALTRTFKSFGLKLASLHYAHSLHSPFWWLKCLSGPTKTGIYAVDMYHRFLVWDLMKQPVITRLLDLCLNPLLGKSLVLYFKKP